MLPCGSGAQIDTVGDLAAMLGQGDAVRRRPKLLWVTLPCLHEPNGLRCSISFLCSLMPDTATVLGRALGVVGEERVMRSPTMTG